MYDVIIVGNGPAGISASLYLKRAKKNVLVIGKGIGALEKADKIENYYGIESISGTDLHERGIKQAQRLGIEIITDEVIGLYYDTGFKVVTSNREYLAQKVILATGTNRQTPNVKGIKEFEGKGVSYCAVCDAFFYRGKDVAVLGNGNYAIHEAEQLRPIVNSVTILTNGEPLLENRSSNSFSVREDIIRQLRGENRVEEVEFENNDIAKVSGVFVAIGTASSSDLAKKIGAVIENNNIVVNDHMETTVSGLYACGDCIGGILQINTAVYEGAKAALHIITNLNKK